MDASWKKFFKNYPKRQALGNVLDEINKQRAKTTIFPPQDEVFKVFDLALEDIKVVILGQDPYHNDNQACGLSFSVKDDVPLPKSLINIYKELHDDLAIAPRKSGNLEIWHEQGVFLLNSVLTVEKNKPASHSNLGWEDFTDYIIKEISNECNNIVFILWGGFARSKKKLIDPKKHYIIESAHPSPLSAYRGFFGSKPFSKTNEFLKSVNKEEIKW
ncbi:uracil-DNA glycosylase [Gemella sp. zg-1178]|uniref:uracil-DNA glycosylase n=1 Tax=Gemella sp. zg-1178 TaxID=2840372 RepID=UPI001C05B2CD|nr:uracil-DNA glycosylase [Gemella sp. zg-1178]MBU0278463.1 uracil-DNA glycosylase [Gemella sp. zg-1178]